MTREPIFLLLALVLALIPWGTDSLRLHLWSGILLPGRIPLKRCLASVLGSELGAALSPTAVGGLPVRIGLLMREGVPAGRAGALAGIKVTEDALFFALALPAALLLLPAHSERELMALARRLGRGEFAVASLPWREILTLALPGILLVTALLLGLRTLGRFLPGLRTRGTALVTADPAEGVVRRADLVPLGASRPRMAVFAGLSFLLTAIQWLARYSVLSAVLASFNLPVEPLLLWISQWVVFTAMTAVPTPGAAGGAEAIFVLTYAGHLPAHLLLGVGLAWRTMTFYLLLATGAILLPVLEIHRRRGKLASTPQTRSSPL